MPPTNHRAVAIASIVSTRTIYRHRDVCDAIDAMWHVIDPMPLSEAVRFVIHVCDVAAASRQPPVECASAIARVTSPSVRAKGNDSGK